jgi:Tat protein secretion system quality control protein TatD with DNase activity
LHPEILSEGQKYEVESIKKMILAHKENVVAVGECGMDLYYP